MDKVLAAGGTVTPIVGAALEIDNLSGGKVMKLLGSAETNWTVRITDGISGLVGFVPAA
jgi:hypothetical protein